MKKKRAYSSVDVERFDVLTILQLLTVGCIIAIDVAKTKMVAAIATASGEVVRLLRFEHPRQTMALLRVVEAIRDASLEPRVVMEPTGTYGDALRYQCFKRGVPVRMISPKHTHDFAEVLDGVPSMHDPKAATVLARLAVIKEGKLWTPPSEERRGLRALMDRRWPVSNVEAIYHGHLEAMLARHWPEFSGHLDVHEQRSWMTLVQQFPGPEAVAASASEAAKTLRAASRGRLSHERIAAFVDAARSSLGVPMTKDEQVKLRSIVASIQQQTVALDAIDEEIAAMVKEDVVMSRLAGVVGAACAGAILAYVGSPTAFANASAFEKAMGLNLKIKSSGENDGKPTVGITKRGPGQVRQLLYLAALRLLQDPIVRAWYCGRKCYGSETGKKKAVVAVMRKIARALWHVGRGAEFDATKLFDVRRLDFTRIPERVAAKHKPAVSQTHTASTRSSKGDIAQQATT